MELEFYKNFITFLYEIGGAVTEASKGIINFLQRTDIIPGYELPFWNFMVGLFLTVIVPYTIIKWIKI